MFHTRGVDNVEKEKKSRKKLFFLQSVELFCIQAYAFHVNTISIDFDMANRALFMSLLHIRPNSLERLCLTQIRLISVLMRIKPPKERECECGGRKNITKFFNIISW